MAIGERIRFFRNLKGLTQKQLGIAVGFSEKTADIRIAQYESNKRQPKEDLVMNLAKMLEVSPSALIVPDIDTVNGLMHTFFALEDVYGLKMHMIDNNVCIYFDNTGRYDNSSIREHFKSWHEEFDKHRCREITREEYDNWRYNFPASPLPENISNKEETDYEDLS